MKVLVLSNLYPPDVVGGYEIACAHVAEALRAKGHDVRVLTGAPRQPVESPPHVLRRFRLIDEWTPQFRQQNPLIYRTAEVESRIVSAHNVHVLNEALDEFHPDVVYVCSVIGAGGLGLMACLQYLKVPWVWQLGDCVPKFLCGTGNTPFPGLADQFSRWIYGHYIVVSNQLRREIESAGIGLRGNVETLPNWITGVRPPARTTFYRGGRLKIMFAGQIGRWKGIDLLIEAAARLRAAGRNDFVIDLYGTLYEADLRQMIQAHDLGRHVVLKGNRTYAEIQQLYSEYDVCAFPTMPREPFGLVPLEAASRGCVAVFSDRCGVAEWLIHGVDCLKSRRDPEALARTFGAIMDRDLDLEPIARRGAAVAWRDFHIDVILPRIERVLVRASEAPRDGAGSPGQAYLLARMAEQLAGALIQESLCA